VENLVITGTETTPQITFTKETGTLLIEGKSLVDDAKTFYKPVLDWLRNYSNQPAKQTELAIKLEYLNTDTSKQFLDLFNQLEKVPNARVVWNFSDEDEDMEEMGQELAELVTIPFEMRSI
jgi:hypothetical protein